MGFKRGDVDTYLSTRKDKNGIVFTVMRTIISLSDIKQQWKE